MAKKGSGHNIIANSTERQKLKAMLTEITHSFRKIEDERDQIKAIVSDASDAFGLDKKVISRIAKMMYKQSYADYKAEQEHFELLYETLVEGLTVVEGGKAA